MPLYRTTYTCYPRRDERWEAASLHELTPDVAIGLNLIHADLLKPADGSAMPELPAPGTRPTRRQSTRRTTRPCIRSATTPARIRAIRG